MIALGSGTAQEATPSVIERLRGLRLGEAVRQFVIADPEVIALIDRAGMQDRFDGGQCPLGVSDYNWPLDAEASEFESRLTNGPGSLLVLGDPERRPTREVSVLSAALADRLGAFREVLLFGKMQAWGLTAQFTEAPIPARLWARKNLSIDVANDDLCEADDRGRLSRLWHSIELKSAVTEVVPGEEIVGRARCSRKPRPKGQEVELILKRTNIDVDALGRKAAAAQVACHMKRPPSSVHETKALETMVGRIWKKR
jgi:hypothetical protein